MTKAITQQYLNPDILGQLTPLATAARVGPQEILELLRNTPKSSRIKYLKWQNNQVTLKGQSQHSADAHALQKALYKNSIYHSQNYPLNLLKYKTKISALTGQSEKSHERLSHPASFFDSCIKLCLIFIIIISTSWMKLAEKAAAAFNQPEPWTLIPKEQQTLFQPHQR